MKRHAQGGFTLIELIVVIVILGILAATALPKFINISSEARTAAAQGFAGAISSGANINYAAVLAGKTSGIVAVGAVGTLSTVSTINVSAVANSMLGSAIPTEYAVNAYSGTATGSTAASVSSTADCGTGNSGGQLVRVYVHGPDSAVATATLVCTG